MIKVFKNIRKTLLAEGKTGKYLKYAIGEIILVVIGILIALQINDWSSQKKRNQLETILLSEISAEIDKVYQDATQDLKLLKFGQRSYGRIMKYVRQNASYADSMKMDFYWLIRDEYIYPKEAVYGKIKQEGVDIIRNDSIKMLIQDLYESHFPRIKINNTYYPNLEHFFYPYYQDHFIPNMEIDKEDSLMSSNHKMIKLPRKLIDISGDTIAYNLGFIPKNFDLLKKDGKFLMLLEESNRARNYKIGSYSLTISQIEKVQELIKKELSND